MSPTTEIAILKLKDSTETLEGSSQAASTWQEILDEILSSEGAQRLYWGKAVEDPSLVRLFIEWESLEHHKKVQASEPYAALIEKIDIIFSEVTLVAHSNLKDLQHTARDVFTSPAAELLTVFFPAEYTAAQQEKFEAGMHQLLKNIEGKAKGARAAAAGWGMESDIANLKISGYKGRAFFLCIGWDRVEDHLQFRGTDAYKDNIHFIRDAEDLRDFLNMHFHGKEMVKG
jgi:quinol monooxygenase YgiN